MCTSFDVIYQSTNVITLLDGFRKDIAHIIVSLLLSKIGTKLDKGGVSGALLNDLSKAFDYTLLDLFNAKLHAQSLGSHIQCIGNAYLGCIEVHLGSCQTSMIELLVKRGND